ncbi:MAG: DUF2795 domain-containing protein [Candidatus Nucleicultricaceae bacterium]
MASAVQNHSTQANPQRISARAMNPAFLERYLKGIHYPATKKELIRRALQNDAPRQVLYALIHFNRKEYVSTIDVAKEVGSMT